MGPCESSLEVVYDCLSEMATTVDQPAAATAATRVFGAAFGLGVLGFGAAALVLARLVESWHVTANASSHHVTLLGERLGYPAANLDALIVLVLAVPSLIAIVLVLTRAAREVLAAATRRRLLEGCSAGSVSGARLIEDERPLAFCAGLLRPRVYVSTGAVALLDERALIAVLEHERHHARRRDPLRLAAGRVLAGSLFFVPGLRELARHQQTLAELGADEAAVAVAPGGRPALARAILGFADTPGGAGVETVRIDRLLGEPIGWSFPAAVCAGAALVIAVVATVAILAGRLASGSATLAPPFLSAQPCVLTLAAISAAVLVAGAAGGRLRGISPLS